MVHGQGLLQGKPQERDKFLRAVRAGHRSRHFHHHQRRRRRIRADSARGYGVRRGESLLHRLVHGADRLRDPASRRVRARARYCESTALRAR